MTSLLHIVVVLGLGLPAPRDTVPGKPLSSRFDLEERLYRFDLPGRLAEVSGLVFGPAGELLAHGDEEGRVFRVDPVEEKVDRGFQLGDRLILDDFEGMAMDGARLFLVSSRGLLYETRVVPEGRQAPVRITDTGVGGGCEVEGLAVHAASRVLLVACKTLAPQAREVRIHRLSLDDPEAHTAGALRPIRIPLRAFEAFGHQGPVNPSGLDVDPVTGTLVLVAARQELIFEVDLEGHLLDVVHLKGKRHPQAEGIVFGPDGRLYVGDEANGDDARITVYGPRREGGR